MKTRHIIVMILIIFSVVVAIAIGFILPSCIYYPEKESKKNYIDFLKRCGYYVPDDWDFNSVLSRTNNATF